jgi:hypothetical protein
VLALIYLYAVRDSHPGNRHSPKITPFITERLSETDDFQVFSWVALVSPAIFVSNLQQSWAEDFFFCLSIVPYFINYNFISTVFTDKVEQTQYMTCSNGEPLGWVGLSLSLISRKTKVFSTICNKEKNIIVFPV